MWYVRSICMNPRINLKVANAVCWYFFYLADIHKSHLLQHHLNIIVYVLNICLMTALPKSCLFYGCRIMNTIQFHLRARRLSEHLWTCAKKIPPAIHALKTKGRDIDANEVWKYLKYFLGTLVFVPVFEAYLFS